MKPDSLNNAYGYVELNSAEEILQYYDKLQEWADVAEYGRPSAEVPASSLDTYSAAEAGWYQSASGELYHYDGIIWDEVPARGLKLEFLGE